MVLQEPTVGSRRPYRFGFGDRHELPDLQPRDPELWTVKAAGVKGEGHLVGKPGGRDITLAVTYAEHNTLFAIETAMATDENQSHELTGRLSIANVLFGKCTFLGGYYERPQVDGKNGKWMARAVLRWRQRETT